MSTPPVPYISQIDSEPRRNDCGPACGLMLARWVGRGGNDTVAQWSQRIDAAQDGTTTADLARMFRELGLTPVTGQAVPYPRLELVTYGKLPRPNPTFAGQTFLHWIVRLSSTTYHDPLWRGTGGANLTGTASAIDAAIYSASSSISIQERPTMSERGKPRQQYERVVHVLPPDATVERVRVVMDAAYPTRQTVGFSYDDAGVGDLDVRRAVLWDIPADKRPAFAEFYRQYYPGVTVEWRGDTVTPPQPPPPQPPPPAPRLPLGVNAMYSEAAAREALQDGARAVVLIESAAGAVNVAREFPDRLVITRVALDRDYLPNPADFVRRTGVNASWPANIVIVGLNEDDQIPFNANIVKRWNWDTDVAERIRAINPGVKYAAWIYPPACNEPGEAQYAQTMRETYARSYNSGQMWMDTHPYGRDENTLWSTNTKGEAEYRWFEGRIEHLFNCCGFDRNGQGRMIYTECGVDKGSVGGFNQLGFTGAQFRRWLDRFAEIHAQYPQVVAACIFQYGDSHPAPYGRHEDKWRGYETRHLRDVYRAFYTGQAQPPAPPPPEPEPPTEPPPPVVVPSTTVLGVHCMSNAGVLGSLARDGAPALLIMDQPGSAVAVADAFLDCVVMYRRFWPHGFRPTAEQIVAAMPAHPRLRYCMLNEWDNWGNTPADIAARADVEIAAARIMRNAGGYGLPLVGGWSHGTPDVWNADIARVMRDKYRDAYNAGLVGMDWHLYSPSVTRPMDQWYEGRWRRVFDDDIGFNPDVRAIYCSETGVDEPNGRGGFPAVGATVEQFGDWCARWLAYQSQPVRGRPSQLVASVIFQHGGNGDPQWNRFEIGQYVWKLKEVWR